MFKMLLFIFMVPAAFGQLSVMPGTVVKNATEREYALFNRIPVIFNIEERTIENAPGFRLLSPVPQLDKSDAQYLEIKKKYFERIVNDVLVEHKKCVTNVFEKHEANIWNSATLRDVDPYVVKAILAFERCYRQNYLVKIDSFFSKVRISKERGKTIPPMNIHRKWAPLYGYSESDLLREDYNIDLAVEYISQIQQRLESPSVSKIASLYNFIGRENVSFYGLVIAEIYQRLRNQVN